MQDIQIINNPSKDEPFIIVNKPSGMHCAPLNENDTENAFYYASKLYPEVINVKGKKEIEHGLIHRIDTVTNGLFLIALTQNAYDSLILQQSSNSIIKTYSAECKIKGNLTLAGFPEIPSFSALPFTDKTISSYFRFYGPGNKEVRPVLKESQNKYAKAKIGKAKMYTTEINVIEQKPDYVKVKCKITNGFRHQVRCHLAWLGLPIINDPLYNTDTVNGEILFTASGLQFENPVTKQPATFSLNS